MLSFFKQNMERFNALQSLTCPKPELVDKIISKFNVSDLQEAFSKHYNTVPEKKKYEQAALTAFKLFAAKNPLEYAQEVKRLKDIPTPTITETQTLQTLQSSGVVRFAVRSLLTILENSSQPSIYKNQHELRGITPQIDHLLALKQILADTPKLKLKKEELAIIETSAYSLVQKSANSDKAADEKAADIANIANAFRDISGQSLPIAPNVASCFSRKPDSPDKTSTLEALQQLRTDLLTQSNSTVPSLDYTAERAALMLQLQTIDVSNGNDGKEKLSEQNARDLADAIFESDGTEEAIKELLSQAIYKGNGTPEEPKYYTAGNLEEAATNALTTLKESLPTEESLAAAKADKETKQANKNTATAALAELDATFPELNQLAAGQDQRQNRGSQRF